eukprot:TRINITY_DN215_c0_g1_i1.p2 TRINITY_DN215_c0_g1~~TRINITY_DN215_c0_g1_i1.p2  ORF type:complete len:223 (+),score=74.03 TRINITY_DN215_c0_g1_i1:542-1210(+)
MAAEFLNYDPSEKLEEMEQWFMESGAEALEDEIPGEHFRGLLERVGFTFADALWKNIRAGINRSKMTDPVDFGDLYDAFVFLDSSARLFFSVAGESDVVTNDKCFELFQMSGYTFSEDAGNAVVAAADEDNTGSFDLEGWIRVQLFVRFSIDHFWANARELGEETTALPFETMKEIFPWMGVENASDEEARKLFDEADADGNGTIDLDEFLVILSKIKYGRQ